MRRTSVRMKRITSTLRMLRSRQRWRLPDLRPAAMFLRMIEKEELMKAGVRRLRRDGESPNVRSRGLPPASPEQAPTLLLRDPPHHAALPLDACPQPAHAHRPRRPRPLQPAVAKRSSCCQAVGQVDEAVGKESSCWQGRAPSAVTMTAATRCTRGSSTRLPSPWRGPTARRTTRCQCPPPRSPWRPVSRLRAACEGIAQTKRKCTVQCFKRILFVENLLNSSGIGILVWPWSFLESLSPRFTGLGGSVFPTHLAAPGQVWWRGA